MFQKISRKSSPAFCAMLVSAKSLERIAAEIKAIPEIISIKGDKPSFFYPHSVFHILFFIFERLIELIKITVTSPEQAETSMTAAQTAPITNIITPSIALAKARKTADSITATHYSHNAEFIIKAKLIYIIICISKPPYIISDLGFAEKPKSMGTLIQKHLLQSSGKSQRFYAARNFFDSERCSGVFPKNTFFCIRSRYTAVNMLAISANLQEPDSRGPHARITKSLLQNLQGRNAAVERKATIEDSAVTGIRFWSPPISSISRVPSAHEELRH